MDSSSCLANPQKLTWATLQAARNSGFTFGVQFKPQGLVSLPTEYLQHRALSQLPQDAAQHISYALAYSPEGQSTFGEMSTMQHSPCALSISNRHMVLLLAAAAVMNLLV